MSYAMLNVPRATSDIFHLDITARDESVLDWAIGSFFFSSLDALCVCVDGNGFHVIAAAGRESFYEDDDWSQPRDLRTVCQEIMSWLDGLTPAEKRAINRAVPMEGAHHVPGASLRLAGFNVASSMSADRRHYKLWVIPAWVPVPNGEQGRGSA